MEFVDSWLWLIFVGIGLLLILIELVVGVETEMDLVLIGSAFILGGLVTYPFTSMPVTIVVTIVLIAAVFIALRPWLKRKLAVPHIPTNIDAVMGKRGIVIRKISALSDGKVKVGNEQWRARSETEIAEGDTVIVKSISGTTLTVVKEEEGGAK